MCLFSAFPKLSRRLVCQLYRDRDPNGPITRVKTSGYARRFRPRTTVDKLSPVSFAICRSERPRSCRELSFLTFTSTLGLPSARPTKVGQGCVVGVISYG